jgi:hypothetical protein
MFYVTLLHIYIKYDTKLNSEEMQLCVNRGDNSKSMQECGRK